jgi:hydrogenase maturation protease
MATDRVSVQVIGLGHPYRGDDAIGLEVARAIRRQTSAVDVVTAVSDGTMLLDLWTEVPLCLVVDAAVSGRPPGTIHEFDGLTDQIPERLFSSFSTHACSVPEAIALGRTLDRLPRQLYVVGIEGCEFACGTHISDPVRRAGEEVVKRVLGRIHAHRSGRIRARAR